MGFDTATYQRLSARLEVEDIDFDAFRSQPLDPRPSGASATCTMSRATPSATCATSSSPAPSRPEITSFLTMWNYEEFWHGDAIGKVLAAHDESAGTGRIAALRQRLPKGDRWKPLVSRSPPRSPRT